ncbi:MAG: OmpA family protein [Endomicrobia bacterium]|nr:OmpA family protein [Endomicrobiia bacterium]
MNLVYRTTTTFENSTTTFTGNSASGNGGAISVTGSNTDGNTFLNFTGSSVTFTENRATGVSSLGGAIYIAGGTGGTPGNRTSFLNFTNSSVIFSVNSSNSNGGALYLADRTSAAFTNSSIAFTENVTANGSGGAIYITGSNSLLDFINSNAAFSDNRASVGGGAIELQSGSIVNFSGSTVTFNNNIAAGNAAGALHVMQSIVNVANSSMSFNNNNARDNGGAIDAWQTSYMSVHNSYLEFNNNISSAVPVGGQGGGAIFIGNGTRAIFNEVEAHFSVNSSSRSGGAIYVGGTAYSTMTFTDSTLIFNGNVAASSGGAIYIGNYSTVTFNNSAVSFLSNNAQNNDGGAIYITATSINDRSYLNFIDSTATFSSNTASASGGAMYLASYTNTTFTNSFATFIGNKAESGSGGAIYAGGGTNYSTMTFTDSTLTFRENIAASSGGAVFLDPRGNMTFRNTNIEAIGNISQTGSGGFLYASATTAVSGTVFNGSVNVSGNRAALYGGGIYTERSLTFNGDVELTGNTAQRGGAIYATGGSTITFSGLSTTINYNESKLDAAEGNGVIYMNGTSIVRFLDTYLRAIGNEAYNGGFLYLNNNGNTDFTRNVNLSNNKARVSGGALYVTGTWIGAGTRTTVLNFNGIDVNMSGNTANVFGGAVYATSSNSALNFNGSNVTFSSNTANEGGAIYAVSGTTLAFTESSVSFNHNKADTGGAIFINSNSSSLSFTNSVVTFTNNTAAGSGGGAIFLGGGSINFTGSAVTAVGNKAENGFGGFLYSISVAVFGNVTITSNTANSGGAIYADNSFSNLNFSGNLTTFNYNTATSSGGAIYADDDSRLNFTGSSTIFNNNRATSSGGAIFASSANINFTNIVTFTSNTASSGGAIYASSGTALTFSGSSTKFNYNSATGTNSGGALYIIGTSVTFDGGFVWFTGNNSAGSGGAIYSKSSTLNFRSSSTHFTDNYAFNGGAIYLNGGNIDFSSTSLTAAENTANHFGGFLHAENAGVIFGEVEMTGNMANHGGAIYADGNTTLTFSSVTAFNNNSASGNGGAIYAVNNTTLTFNGSSTIFQNNRAGDGGAVYVANGGFAEFYNASFTNNSSEGKGGAVYVESLSNVISVVHFYSNNSNGTVFENNTAANADSGNGLYAGRNSKIYFITDFGASVEMRDSIAGSADNAKIFIGGAGDFNLYANSLNNHANIYLSGGNFNFKDGASFSAGLFEYSTGTILNMQDGQQNKLYVKDLKADGTLKMDLISGDAGDKICVDGTATLGSSSELITNISNMNFRKQIFTLINYSVLLESFSAYDVINISSGVSVSSYSLQYDYLLEDKNWIALTVYGDNLQTNFSKLEGITFNQKQTAGVYDVLSADSAGDLDYIISKIEGLEEKGQRRALSQAAGYFIANVIRSGGADGGSNEIYDRIKNSDGMIRSKDLWLQAKVNVIMNQGDENSINDYTDTAIGVSAGYDIFTAEPDIMFGIFGKINKHNVSQDPNNTADVTNTGLGLYGGIIKDKWEVKGLLSGSLDSYSTERYIEFAHREASSEFKGMTLNADIEGAGKKPINDITDFRYYAGMEIRNSSYDGINESGAESLNLIVSRNSYKRVAARLGAGVNQEREKYAWHVRGEYKYLLDGDLPEIESKFEGTGSSFKTRGSKEGKGAAGVRAGGVVNVTPDIKLFANASFYTADRYRNIYANAGIRYTLSSVYNEMIVQNIEAKEKARKERKRINAETAVYEKTRRIREREKRRIEKEEEKERIKAEKEKAAAAAALSLTVPLHQDIRANDAHTQPEKRRTDAKIMEYEIMLAAERKTEDALIIAERQKAKEEIRKKQEEQARHTEERRKRVSAEISDEDLMKKKKEIQGRMLKPILESFELRFMSGKHELSPHWMIELKKQAEAIKKYEYKKISIEGHADTFENTPKKLSRLRAKTVYDEFVNSGISAEKIEYVGVSSVLPAASNDTEAGRMANRRVVVVVE